MRPEDFRAPYITREQAWAQADSFRARCWPAGTIPIEVEEMLIPVGLRLDYRKLKHIGETVALLSGDLKLIHVDTEQYMNDRLQNRVRFSIAHELGHFVLHPHIYRNIGYSTVEEWIDFIERVPAKEYGFVEYQAYEFAGRLLVPVEQLRLHFQSAVSAAQQAGFAAWDKAGDAARDYIATAIAPEFGVSGDVIEKRILREGLWPPALAKT